MTAVKASAAKMKTIHHEMSGAGVQETTFSTPIPQPPSAEDRVGAETVGARRSFFEGEWSQKWSTGHTASVTIDLSEASTGAPRQLPLGAPCSASVVRRTHSLDRGLRPYMLLVSRPMARLSSRLRVRVEGVQQHVAQGGLQISRSRNYLSRRLLLLQWPDT